MLANLSMTLEIIERLAAALAAPQGLATRRTEFGDHLRVFRSALRTGDFRLRKQRPASAAMRRRCDAIGEQFAPALPAQPIRRPGRRQHDMDVCLADAFFFK